MKRLLMSMAAVGMFSCVSFAGEAGEKTCTGETCSKTATASCEGGSCPIEAAMAKLPKMTYMIGTESTSCSHSAEALAEKHGKPVQFVAMNKTYDSKSDAMVALAEGTEQFVSTFASTKTCSVSGKMTAAGKEMTCEVMAGARVAAAKKAMAGVNMTYLVGTKSCNCPMEAASLAKTSGSAKQFVIAGEPTSCSVDARVKLATAKYKAAVEALAKLDQPAAATNL